MGKRRESIERYGNMPAMSITDETFAICLTRSSKRVKMYMYYSRVIMVVVLSTGIIPVLI